MKHQTKNHCGFHYRLLCKEFECALYAPGPPRRCELVQEISSSTFMEYKPEMAQVGRGC